jgi:folate-dependent phosphoribosylglycinamide formyltransferase PurN
MRYRSRTLRDLIHWPDAVFDGTRAMGLGAGIHWPFGSALSSDASQFSTRGLLEQQQGRLRIILVLSDSLFFQPRFVHRLLHACSERALICGIVLTSVLGHNMPVHRFLIKLWVTLGPTDFLRLLALFIKKRCLHYVDRFWRLSEPASVASVARRNKIEIHRVQDINSPQSVSWIREREPDVLVCGCFQLFGKKLLALPKLGCINRHCSLLPNYRGLFPAFWALLNGERESGVSVHLMNEEFDSGHILSQTKVPLRDGETLYQFVERCYELSAKTVCDAIGELQDNRGNTVTKQRRGRYFSYPNKSDLSRFRACGHSVL